MSTTSQQAACSCIIEGIHRASDSNLAGEATVLRIGPCDVDSRETPRGMSIVTGKIRHRYATVWDLTFDGRTEETLGVTATHPLYSETRHAWIPAGDLQLDEVDPKPDKRPGEIRDHDTVVA